MKLELRENMIVRTKDGYISQYKYYDYNIGEGLIGKLLCIPLSNGTFANIENIKKFSYNIIDLLEVGDVVVTNNLCGEITKIDKENNRIYTTSYDEESDDPVDSMFKKQEKTVRIAVLYPENIDIIMDRMGGLATVLSDAILAKSGFDIKNTSIL